MLYYVSQFNLRMGITLLNRTRKCCLISLLILYILDHVQIAYMSTYKFVSDASIFIVRCSTLLAYVTSLVSTSITSVSIIWLVGWYNHKSNICNSQHSRGMSNMMCLFVYRSSSMVMVWATWCKPMHNLLEVWGHDRR